MIKIIRHSERLDYANPLLWAVSFGYHSSDPPLTTRGCEMVESKAVEYLTQGFNPTKIYTSPYIRTMTTASIMQKYWPNAAMFVDSGLSEYQSWSRHCTHMYPKGIESDYTFPETKSVMRARAKETIDKLIAQQSGDILIVTHGAIVKAYADSINDGTLDTSNIPYLATLDVTNRRIDY